MADCPRKSYPIHWYLFISPQPASCLVSTGWGKRSNILCVSVFCLSLISLSIPSLDNLLDDHQHLC